MRKRNALSIVVMLATSAALAGCGISGPLIAPGPSGTGSATDSPVPTPDMPDGPVAASVAISAETIAVLDADGVTLVSFDYFQPTAEVVTGLSEYLGAPVDTANPGAIESPPGVDHVWGDLRLFDTEPPGNAPEDANHFVFVEGPSAGALPVRTAAGVGSAAGVRVGDPVSSMTIGVEFSSTSTDPETGVATNVHRIGIVPLPPHPDSVMEHNLGVMVMSHSDTQLIERLIAPNSNYGV
jgi:predicted small lipoprotein YifL